MTKSRKLILFACAAATIIGGYILVVLLLRSPEPTYQGRTLSAWRNDWITRKNFGWPNAIQHIGTNAIPYEVRNLALNDSWWHTNYAALQPKLPSLLRKVFPPPKPLLKEVDGANVFFHAGSNSVPYAIALLKHRSATVRRAAAWGLGSLRKQTSAATNAVPFLIDALADSDRMVRFDACGSLRDMGSDAASAVPALTRVVAETRVGAQTNDFFYVRAIAAVALGKIGPAASNSLPTLRAALQESNFYLRGQAAVAMWRISSNVDTLPVLLREMSSSKSEDMKWDWIIALGEMGPRAKEACPQLKPSCSRII